MFMLRGKYPTNKRYFSVSKDINRDTNSITLDNFYNWLVGFTDGEGLFYINIVKNSHNAVFVFKITLHSDDALVLEFIKKNLGFGEVYYSKNRASFIVSNLMDVKVLIDIFSKYTLNTSKYLNYLDFKKAFELYTGSKKKIFRNN